MSFWSFVQPVATIAGTAFGGPMGGMAAGGITGALAGKEKQDAEMARQRQTANAAADAQAVSWATRDGRGFVPETQFAQGTMAGNVLGGATSGGMSGYSMGKNMEGMNWQDLFGSKNAGGGTGYLGVDTQLGQQASTQPQAFSLNKRYL